MMYFDLICSSEKSIKMHADDTFPSFGLKI